MPSRKPPRPRRAPAPAVVLALPPSVHTVLGAITVERVDMIRNPDGSPCPDDLGEFSYHTRAIRVLDSLHPTQAYHTMRHEWAHAVLFDSGIYNVLSKRLTEQLCDILATALTAEAVAEATATR